jgi:hypothetical protein
MCDEVIGYWLLVTGYETKNQKLHLNTPPNRRHRFL